MVTAASIYYVVPKIFKTEIYSVTVANIHFWLVLVGQLAFSVTMWITGIQQGALIFAGIMLIIMALAMSGRPHDAVAPLESALADRPDVLARGVVDEHFAPAHIRHVQGAVLRVGEAVDRLADHAAAFVLPEVLEGAGLEVDDLDFVDCADPGGPFRVGGGVAIVDDGTTEAVIISLDTIGASGTLVSRIRERVQDPATASKLIPVNHGFGTRRVPMETGYYEVFAGYLQGADRATNTPYSVLHGGGTATQTVDQRHVLRLGVAGDGDVRLAQLGGTRLHQLFDGGGAPALPHQIGQGE